MSEASFGAAHGAGPDESPRPHHGTAPVGAVRAGAAFGWIQPETRQRAAMARTIETEIIPRLLLVHRESEAQPSGSPTAAARLTHDDVTEFTALAIANDPAPAFAYVDLLQHRGIAAEAICLDLLAPAARRLGVMWEEDTCDFTDVAVGLSRLHQILRRLSPRFGTGPSPSGRERRALLTTIPSDQHTFGLLMVAEFFRNSGWDVRGWPEFSNDEVMALVARETFQLVGVSIACNGQIAPLKQWISAVRAASATPN